VKTSVAQIGANKVRLAVEVPVEDVGKLVDKAYRKLAGEVRVPGFRPGKVPRPIIDQRLGKEYVRSEALRDALPDLFAEAVKDAELDIVAPPELDVTSFEDGKDLIFEAVVEVRPTPELKQYLGLSVSKPPTSVSEEEVAEQLERLRVRYASLEVVNRPLQDGDFALVDLQTYRHDQTIDELTAKDLLVEVGANMLVPEIDKELDGKRKGDILKITTTLPERFGERAGWQVGMQILVKEVKARKLPELDDELAKTVSEFDSLDELRADLRERIEKVKAAQADMAVRERTIEAFVEHGVGVELPDGMVEVEVDRLVRSMSRMLSAQGATLDQYIQAENIDADALRQRLRPQAERNLTLQLGLDAVAKAEAIEVSAEDRSGEAERLAERIGTESDEVRKRLDENDWAAIDGDILRSKALDLLVDRAEITEESSA
jgi:trigger factor